MTKVIEATLQELTNLALSNVRSRPRCDTTTFVQLEALGVDRSNAVFNPQLPRPLTEEEAKLQKLQISDMRKALSGNASIIRKLVQIDNLCSSVCSSHDAGNLRLVKLLRDRQKELYKSREDLAKDNPEAFLALHAQTFRAYVRQLRSGRIVEVPFVKEQIKKIEDGLRGGQIVIIHGETGTGKTEIAKIGSKRFSKKDPLVIRGYSGISGIELFGHMELTSNELSSIKELLKRYESELDEWNKAYPNATEAKKIEIEQLIRAKLTQGNVSVTRFVLGAIYACANEGRVAILDEGNYIPQGLLAKLNDVSTKRPGEQITVQEDGIPPITVKEGFGLILTGNINIGDKRYGEGDGGRQALDLALIDRALLISHNYIPQAIDGNSNAHSADNKQLYAIILTSLLTPFARVAKDKVEATTVIIRLEDRIASLVVPGGAKALEQLWNLAQFASVTNRAFCGEIERTSSFAFQKDGASLSHRPQLSLTPRALIRLLNDWRSSGFEYELDHYLCKHLIDRAPKAMDKAYLYQLGRKFGFFASNGWKELLSPTAPIVSITDLDPKNEAAPIEIVSGRSVIESIYGEAPQRKNWQSAEQQPSDTDTAHALMATVTDLAAVRDQAHELLNEYKWINTILPVDD